MIATHQAMRFPFAVGGAGPGRELFEHIVSSLQLTDMRDAPDATAEYALDWAPTLGEPAVASVNEYVIYDGSLGQALSHLITHINGNAIESVGPVPVVHASVVAFGGRAVVIPGHPGAGKSTLSAALVASGYQYVSDETAPIAADGTVLRYPKPIVVGSGSFAVLAELSVADRAGGALDTWFLDPELLTGGIATEDPLLTYVVLPHFDPGAEVQTSSLTAGEITALLSSNVFGLADHGRSAIERMARFAPDLVGVRIIHGDVHQAVAAIDRMVGR